MNRHMTICFCLALVVPVIPLRAANGPHAGTDNQNAKVWTNDDVARLEDRDLISIVGQADAETSTSESKPRNYEVTQDPQWYAAQAARLRDDLAYRRAQLREYRQALDDARSLKETNGGINLVDEGFAITPEAGIDILQQRVLQEQTGLDDLEDLARRNDIEPGTLRGR